MSATSPSKTGSPVTENPFLFPESITDLAAVPLCTTPTSAPPTIPAYSDNAPVMRSALWSRRRQRRNQIQQRNHPYTSLDKQSAVMATPDNFPLPPPPPNSPLLPAIKKYGKQSDPWPHYHQLLKLQKEQQLLLQQQQQQQQHLTDQVTFKSINQIYL